MATKVWVPRTDDSIDANLTIQGGGSDYFAMIDDTPDPEAGHPNGYDDLTTFLKYLYITEGESEFGLDMDGGVNESVPAGSTSISVMLYYRGYGASAKQTGYYYCGINSNGTKSYDSQITGEGGYTSHSKAYATNPDGSGAWTPATVNAITLLFKGYGGAKSSSDLSQMYTVVTYTAPEVASTAPKMFVFRRTKY